MFPNQFPGFLPSIGAPTFNSGVFSTAAEGQQPTARVMPTVRIADVYQAAKNRAIEDHEIDKLFNAEFYGDEA